MNVLATVASHSPTSLDPVAAVVNPRSVVRIDSAAHQAAEDPRSSADITKTVFAQMEKTR